MTALHSKTKSREIVTLLLVAIFLMLPGIARSAESVPVAVLYPRASSAYEQVFSNMIRGIEGATGITVVPREITPDTDIAELNQWLTESKIQSVITLGSLGYEISDKLPDKIPVVVGAMVITPDGFNGISLAGDPVLFLDNLQKLVPGIKRVFVIYNEQNSGWLIDIARENAKARGIEFVAYDAGNIKDGLKYYDQVLDEANGPEDAIWLPLDRIVPDKAILPKILKSAWDRRFVVFSNNPLHVKQGVLFALYPDHKLMGRRLGELALEKVYSKALPILLPAKNLRIAFNKRTASHLDLHYSKSQQRQFSIIFPSE